MSNEPAPDNGGGPSEARRCPTCSEPAPPETKFCENCATELDTGESLSAGPRPRANPAVSAPCVDCGAAGDNIDRDDYCAMCGAKQPDARDHLELDDGAVAAVTDKGLRHRRNEDACSIAALSTGAVLVVCDGVSTTDHPDRASEAAAEIARQVLERAVSQTLATEPGTDLKKAMQDAVDAAQQAVLAVEPIPGGQGNPSTTIVAAMVLDQGDGKLDVLVGWLGDSRGYWIDRSGATQLTVDHSWANEQIDAGLMPEAEAQADTRAHTITRWLGRDATDVEVSVVRQEVPAEGMLLLCSDGLWNYAADPESLFDLVNGMHHLSPLELARQLTAFAVDSGGHDNITVALARFGDQATMSVTDSEPAP